MNILIPNLDLIHLRNIGACLSSVEGIETALWNPSEKSLIDAFDEVNPSVAFLHENQLDRAFEIACTGRDFKYVLICGSLPSQIVKPPSAVITGQQFLHNFKKEHNAIALQPAANVSQIHGAKHRPELASEVSVMTGGFQVSDDILRMISFLCNSYETKIVGPMPLPFPNYLGQVNIFQRADIIRSSKLFVDFGSYDFLDAQYLKTPCIFAPTNVANLKDLADGILSNKQQRKKMKKEGYQKIVNNDTYYHRCADIFNSIGEGQVADLILQAFKEILK